MREQKLKHIVGFQIQLHAVLSRLGCRENLYRREKKTDYINVITEKKM